jgi:hypothetical protein
VLFFRKPRSPLNAIDIEETRRPLPGLRLTTEQSPDLSCLFTMLDEDERARAKATSPTMHRDVRRVSPSQIPDTGYVRWD